MTTNTTTTKPTTLPEFAADGTRLVSGNGALTKAGHRELTFRAVLARGADETEARRLASVQTGRSKAGTVTAEIGGRAFALSRRECELLGLEPGPGNM